MPSTNLREKLGGMIWEPTDLDTTTYFRFDGASFLAPVAVMECTPRPSDCCAEWPTTKKWNKGANTLRFAAATNSFNANVKAKTVEMTEATEAARTTQSNVVTLKVPSYRESLRNLEKKTQCRLLPLPPPRLKMHSFIKGNSDTHSYNQGTVHMSKDRFIAWFMEDPDPDPPVYQETLPPEVTKFEYSSLYNTGCMWGCSGPPPGTGCPICNPIDLKIPLRSSRPQWDGTG